jgi:uncharacterized protein (DUF2126 family)/transglutaminase-like putative cysteine protease
MAIRVALNHKTEYHYDRAVTLFPQVIRLRPAPHCRTPVLSYSLNVHPKPHFLNWQQDPFSNYQARVVFPAPVERFQVEVDLVAELTAINPFDFFVEEYAQEYPFRYADELRDELSPYLHTEPAGPGLTELVSQARREKIRINDFLVDVNRHLSRAISYIIRMEPGVQTCEETLTRGKGSCRDTAWLLVQLMRHLGVAARFASGYLIQLTADEKPLEGPAGPTKDFTDLHAWTEVYLPGAGWVGLDPTSGLLAGEGHLPLACSPHPVGAAPITGSFNFTKDPARGEDDKCETVFHFAMSVTRIHEDPRVTKPYTPEQWEKIDSLGHRIDEDLEHADVRLTMGGEPTFVSIDDRDGAEWNTAAQGPGKRRQAGVLVRRLRDRFAAGGLLHFGQGKWYPGESLPRWSLNCYWRRDGVPIWADPKLVAEDDRDYGHSSTDARRFVAHLARELGVDPAFSVPAHEDVWYYLWRERQLPTNVDPLESYLDDPEVRERLARIFDQGLDKIVGYALPLRVGNRSAGQRWESGKWFFRREHMFLTPGDSPMGFRLPLDSLPWEEPEHRDVMHPLDPMAPRRPLPSQHRQATQPGQATDGAARFRQQPPPDMGVSDFEGTPTGLIRTALCVEPRGGAMHVFLPPQRLSEDYLEVVTAVENTAAALQIPVFVEGYDPPKDHRLSHFRVTPDPGVIEVNVQPAHSWEELSHNTHVLYEEARQSRLTAEKFMLDGRHIGTGGGNHVVLGGPTPADSPILRRPDLLRSLVGYWHNHPSLSYLFSGMFVGPTSQAPRVDEARNDALYELEIAFKQIPEHGGCAPWLVDRIFRHLLVDVTGNTHRAEFCIDKLYSPDSASGRLGLVEFRAFEMPPHPQMSLVQQVLLRALVARFWNTPYQTKLARWGTELHDRFLLPHFVWQDFQDVIDEIRQAGFALDEQWFAPHFDFRFPRSGSVVQRGIDLELRQAIEPWHVLGEEQGGGGTARYVDSSVERLQVKVNGLTDTRHIVTCNGRRVPLHPTGVNGEFVAGVRYRAWQPPSCLHPTIPSHAPVTFDILDTWMNRSLGGCQYHVAHPGGRGYDIFPVNANEAEGRRISRFLAIGHTPGRIHVPPEERSPESPFTLDLRRPVSSNDAAHSTNPSPFSRNGTVHPKETSGIIANTNTTGDATAATSPVVRG